MPFLSLCCASSHSSKRAEAEAETRRARIVPILDPSAYHHHQRRNSYNQHNELPPPRYEDVSNSVSLHAVPVLVTDEKDETVLRVLEVEPHTVRDQRRSLQLQISAGDEVNASGALHFEGSDRSSVISIPSTQVTGLGSSYTGTTTLRGDVTGRTSRDDGLGSGRLSETGTLNEYHNSRPPSYYASSLQRRSPSPGSGSEGGDSVWRHPVMRQGWFEHLRGTRGEGEWRP